VRKRFRHFGFRTVAFPEECLAIPVDESHPRFTAPHEVQALCWLARQTSGDILEIGCNEGRTSRDLAVANPNKRVFAIDYAGRDATLCPGQKHEKPTAANIGRLARDLPNVSIRNVKSQHINLSRKPLSSVRFIFIDGDHSYAGVKTDTEMALAHIERFSQGTIVWHDCHQDPPEWLKVYEYLDREVAPHYRLDVIDSTWLAVLRFGEPLFT
jgi:precorrin-6B methylase 2